MKYKEKISVIIPTYNREKVLMPSIESVLNQTYDNLELIIVDDGSKDNTDKMIKKMKDKRVKYIKLEKNSGACVARNRGIEEATGDYIAFQDSDDIFHKDKLEKQLNNLKNNNSDLDFCKINVNNDGYTVEIPNDKIIESVNSGNALDELCNGNFISTQAIVMKKEIAKKTMFDVKLPRLQDYDFVMRIAPQYKITCTNEVLVELYKQADSISNSVEKLKKASMLILNKNYNISSDQHYRIIEYLLNMWDISMKDKAEREKSEISDQLVQLQNENNNLKQKIEDTENAKSDIENKYNTIEEKYNDIINSKRWKTVDKVCRVLRKN